METKVTPKVDHTPAELDDEAKVLLKAAAFLEEHAWGDGRAGSGTHCAYMAMVQVVDPEANSTPLSTRAAARFSSALGFDGKVTAIFPWNDAAGRTKDEVVAKLRAVALLHRD